MFRISGFTLVAVFLAAAASASPAGSSRILTTTKMVRTADLDLRLARDQQRLLKRVHSAAYFVCMYDDLGRYQSPPAADRQACHDAAFAAAQPRLAQLFARGGAGEGDRLALLASTVTVASAR